MHSFLIIIFGTVGLGLASDTEGLGLERLGLALDFANTSVLAWNALCTSLPGCHSLAVLERFVFMSC